MKKMILLSILLIFAQSAISENFYNGLSRLEKQIFKQTYEYDLPENRMERLETKMFGTCQSGNMRDRYLLLQNAAKNYKAYNSRFYDGGNKRIYNNYRPPIFTGSTGSSWKNMLWGNFMNQFAGYPTGLTPTLSQGMDPAYMDYFEAEREMVKNGYNSYNNGNSTYYQTPYGYRTTKTDRGYGTGVHILD